MITSIDGFKAGHYTDLKGVTGCTVILCPENTVGSCDIRGNSPGSRETALLAPDKTMMQVNGILLTGGSAFGLSAADGVVRFLKELKIGYKTPWGRIPIVPAAVVFDLNLGDAGAAPDTNAGYIAARSARVGKIEGGSVGVGTGVTVGKWGGTDSWMKGGIGHAIKEYNDVIAAALAVVNSIGDIYDNNNRIIAGARDYKGGFKAEKESVIPFSGRDVHAGTNTTLVTVATNAKLDKVEVYRMCQRANSGMARVIKPVHTSHDGDVVFGLANGKVVAPFDIVAEMAAEVTIEAIRDGVKKAGSVAGVPGISEI